ncbi:MAG: dehypoxanthine futalosine cyclase [Granulicella sp.]
MGITREQALDYCNSDDLIGIGMAADAIRRQLHPENVVTYTIDRTLALNDPHLDHKAEEALDMGATALILRADTSLSLPAIEQALAALSTRYPALTLHGLSATTIVALGGHLADTLARLQASGLASLSGNDAAILDDAVQSPTPRCTVAEWLAVHRAAHALGLPTTAAMHFGAGETHEHRIAHLEALNHLQQETGGFTAFVPTVFQPAASGLRGFEEATAVEYLKTLSIARLVLDTIPNLQADWPTQGLKTLQVSLRFGANDVGTTLPGDTLKSPDGTTEEDLRRIIRGAGLRPAQRDTTYRTLFLN